MLNPVINDHEGNPKWRLLPTSSSPAPTRLGCWEGLPRLHYGHPGVTPVNAAWEGSTWPAVAGEEESMKAGPEWMGQPLHSEIREATCLLLPAPLLPTIYSHPSWPFHAPTSDSFQIQGVKLHWKQTITPTVKGRKQCLIAVLRQCQHINPSLTRQLKINKNATLMYIQKSGKTICPIYRVITRRPSSVLTNQKISIKGN